MTADEALEIVLEEQRHRNGELRLADIATIQKANP